MQIKNGEEINPVSEQKVYGGIEGGGTKFICAVGTGPEDIVDEARFPTTSPSETLARVASFFKPYTSQGHIASIGLGSFGPLDLDPASTTFGYITTTPKPAWAFTNIFGYLKQQIGIPMIIDMDVVASAMGEYRWGASYGYDLSLYLTVGTGIGGSFIMNSRPLRGLVSLEMGHIRIPHDRSADTFGGNCPYHGDCFEGLASGPAIQARFGCSAESLADDDPFWDLEAGYIAFALSDYILTLPPQIIILGGGVMHRYFLYEKIRSRLSSLLNNYLNHPIFLKPLDSYVIPPALGYRSGVLGGIAIATTLVDYPDPQRKIKNNS